MLVYLFLFLSTLVVGSLEQAANIEYDGSVSISLYHALTLDTNPTFTERGNVTIKSLRDGIATVSNNVLSEDERLQLQQLSSNGKLYRLKAIVKNIDGSVSELLTFVKACMLGNSDLNDKLTVSLDHAGIVVGVHLSVPEALLCENSDSTITRDSFETIVHVQHTEQGVIPDTASYIQKIERDREAREKGETKDNRSFLSKYWMYIVPAVILMVISSAANPDAAGGGGGGR